MAFTPKLTFASAWLTSAVAFKAIKVIKYAKNHLKKQTNSWPKINFSVALPGQNYRLLVPQNEGLNLSFVKDIHVVGKKMARNGHKMAIYES